MATAMRSLAQDAEVTALLREFDQVTARLFELGVNPFKRCVCPWDQPHAKHCPMYREEHRPHMQSRPQDCNLRREPVCQIPACGCTGKAHP